MAGRAAVGRPFLAAQPAIGYIPKTQDARQGETQDDVKHKRDISVSGSTTREREVNMFGSAAYVQEEFELSRKDAQRVVEEWMQQFSV